MSEEIRKPAVAGYFYPANKDELIKLIENCFKHPLGPGKLPKEITPRNSYRIIAAQVPHAGYIYSGPCAAWAYLELYIDGKPDTIVILGPNHTGLGLPVSVWPRGYWETPLGRLEIDKEVVDILLQHEVFASDYSAHVQEHSIEVQLPFVQYIFGNDVKIVPICIADPRLETAEEISKGILHAIAETKKRILILASSDMTHYEPQDVAQMKDSEALDAIISLDVKKLYELVESGLTMCGFAPVSVAMLVASHFKAGGHVVKYYTSGDIIGDISSVVGYASVVFEKGIPIKKPKKPIKEEITPSI